MAGLPWLAQTITTSQRTGVDIQKVADSLKDPLALPRWWPEVYLCVDEIEPGDENGAGQVVELHTRGWLPYTLRWRFRVLESNYSHGSRIQAIGDLEGEGAWKLSQDGEGVEVTFHWRVKTNKPLLGRLSWLLKPLFTYNHKWAMARGEESLLRELGRYREHSDRKSSYYGLTRSSNNA